MKTITNITTAMIILCLWTPLTRAQDEGVIAGLDTPYSYSAAEYGDKAISCPLEIAGEDFKAIILYYNGSTAVTMEASNGQRSLIFIGGRPNSPSGENIQTIGFSGKTESKKNSYTVGTHDFTNDGKSELVIGIRAADGFSVFVFAYTEGKWKCIGNMVTKNRDIRSCRVFRQTLTIKDASDGTLYTWTYHNEGFDFRSSDNHNEPSALYM